MASTEGNRSHHAPSTSVAPADVEAPALAWSAPPPPAAGPTMTWSWSLVRERLRSAPVRHASQPAGA